MHPSLSTSYTEQVSKVVKLLQGKWTLQILCAMRAGPVRLSELMLWRVQHENQRIESVSRLFCESAKLLV
jgi:DNA-binding HxlR family transcriptional regulator